MPMPFRRGREGGQPDPEELLASRLQALDSNAWGELYDRHHAQVWRYVHGRTGDRDLADDIAAQVFVEALESIGRYRYRGRPLLAWLYAIARHQTGKRLRADRRPLPQPAATAAPSPEERLDAIAISAALRQLKPQQRDVLVLRFYARCTTPEIGRILGKSESAVYSLEIRALKALKKRLGPNISEFSDGSDENRDAAGIDTVR
jgi:RNA polymerase sigma-70 factor, ECF subfamily